MSALNRERAIETLCTTREPFDILIIGGGATGLGIAVDAASRGYKTALLEMRDFASGTSSRSTKLIHGGVRYLQQGNVKLVHEALRERGRLRRNAPHIVHDLAFIVPSYQWWQSPYYGVGLKVYDLLAGRYGLNRSSHMSREEVLNAFPNMKRDGLRGGTMYYDGQFDDARLAISLAATAAERGATLANYCSVIGFAKNAAGRITAVAARDEETGESFEIPAKVVINATGPFADTVRRLDRDNAKAILSLSQGTHIVLDRSFGSTTTAVTAPHTPDGRVMFIIPWHNILLLGTTDESINAAPREPAPTAGEIDLILKTANQYLERPATRADIRSVFAGVRPLVREEDTDDTAALSREHSIFIDDASKLLTIVGGKWTTYRVMAEDAVDRAIPLGDLDPHKCITRELPIAQLQFDIDTSRDARLDARLRLTQENIESFCHNEMARSVDDILSRRTRSIIIDARATMETAPQVAQIMAAELGRDQSWIDAQLQSFRAIAAAHLPRSKPQ